MPKINSLIILTIITTGLTLPYLMYVYVPTHVENSLISSLHDQVHKRLGAATIILEDKTGNRLPSTPIQISASSLDFMLGAGVWTTTATQSWTNSDWEYYRNAGFEYEQIWTTWRLIEPTQNQFDYSSVKGQMDYVRAHNPHAKFFARLQGIVPDPLVGNSLNDSAPPSFTNFTSSAPSDPSAYLNQVKAYVRALVSKYAGQIDVWVTPVEINRIDYATAAFNLPTSPYSLQDAIAIDRVVAEAVKEANPKATLILGTSTPLSAYETNTETRVDPIVFEQMAITAGVPFDDVAVEVYAFSGDLSFWFGYLNEMSKLGHPIFINEAGFSSEGVDYAKLEPARTAQDSWYQALLTLSLAMQPIVGFFILEFKDRALQARYSQFETMGLIDSSGQPKPSYQGIQLILQTLTELKETSRDGQVTVRLLAGNYVLHANEAEGKFRIVQGTNQTFIMQIENNGQLETITASTSVLSPNKIENEQMGMQLIRASSVVSALITSNLWDLPSLNPPDDVH